jgi:hypothetical protein
MLILLVPTPAALALITPLTIHHAFGCSTRTYSETVAAETFPSEPKFAVRLGKLQQTLQNYVPTMQTRTKLDNIVATTSSQLDVKTIHNYNNSFEPISLLIVPIAIDEKRLKFFLQHLHM